jgi:hypothetical protein
MPIGTEKNISTISTTSQNSIEIISIQTQRFLPLQPPIVK